MMTGLRRAEKRSDMARTSAACSVVVSADTPFERIVDIYATSAFWRSQLIPLLLAPI
jgi:hypothetical protein